jgi:pSer/pThr/pTyr-binding forkhead associated (FHA) protein
MARLILVFKKKVIKEYTFSKESMTIGRDGTNDIVIDNLAVSSRHARIDKTGDSYVLTDLKSTNGTFVNNTKISSHILQYKDKITIGKHLLFFAMSRQELEKTHKAEELDRTMVLDTAQQKELLMKQSKETEKVAPQASSHQEKTGIISFIDGSGEEEIQITKKITKIGKGKNSEIRIGGLFMPPTAATISRRPNGYAITAITTKTKVKINNEVIKESHYLKDFDMIEIGSYKFQFYYQDLEDRK